MNQGEESPQQTSQLHHRCVFQGSRGRTFSSMAPANVGGKTQRHFLQSAAEVTLYMRRPLYSFGGVPRNVSKRSPLIITLMVTLRCAWSRRPSRQPVRSGLLSHHEHTVADVPVRRHPSHQNCGWYRRSKEDSHKALGLHCYRGRFVRRPGAASGVRASGEGQVWDNGVLPATLGNRINCHSSAATGQRSLTVRLVGMIAACLALKMSQSMRPFSAILAGHAVQVAVS